MTETEDGVPMKSEGEEEEEEVSGDRSDYDDEEYDDDGEEYSDEDDYDEEDENGDDPAGDNSVGKSSEQTSPTTPDLKETPKAEFRCAYTKGGSVQGKLLLLKSALVFVAQFFSNTRIVINYSSIVQVHKRNTALIFPNAIEFVANDGARFLFTSFISRDQAYAAICSVLRAFAETEQYTLELSMSEMSESVHADSANVVSEDEDDLSENTQHSATSAQPQNTLSSSTASIPEITVSAATTTNDGQEEDAKSKRRSASRKNSVSTSPQPIIEVPRETPGDLPSPTENAPKNDAAEVAGESVAEVPEDNAGTSSTSCSPSQQTTQEKKKKKPAALGDVPPEPSDGCQKHFSADVLKLSESKKDVFPLKPADLYQLFLAPEGGFWQKLYNDEKYTDIDFPPWSQQEGCTCIGRDIQFNTVITHALVGTKTCHLNNRQYLTTQQDGTIILCSQNQMGPELPYSSSYYVESIVKLIPNPTTGGTTVTVSIHTVFIKSVFVRSIIEKSAVAGLFPLYDKIFARLHEVCDAQMVPPSVPRKKRGSQRRGGTNDKKRRPKRAADDNKSRSDVEQNVAQSAAPVSSAASSASTIAAAGPDQSNTDWIRKLIRIFVVPIRTPSFIRDAVVALLLSLITSGLITSSLRLQLEEQKSQIALLNQQVAELRAFQNKLRKEIDGGVSISLDNSENVSSVFREQHIGDEQIQQNLSNTLPRDDITRILELLYAAHDLAETVDVDYLLSLTSSGNDTSTKSVLLKERMYQAKPSKQDRWTIIIVSCVILLIVGFLIFTRLS